METPKMPEMEKTGVAAGRLLRLEPRAVAAPAALHARLSPSSSSSEVNDDKLTSLLHVRMGNLSQGPRVQPTGQVGPHGRGWERYLGLPIKQTNGTCVLVACIGCLEAVHRFEYEKVHGEGTFFIPRTRRADEPLQKLFDECRADGTWVQGRGAAVGKVLDKIQAMGRVEVAANAPTPAAASILPLRSWRRHTWDGDSGTGLSPGRVAAALMDGPCVVVLWVCPPYFDVDAGRDDAAVYRGCGRTKLARIHSKHLYGDKAGFHAVVCFAYRFRGEQQMDVLVMDNHNDETGPRRWIDVEEVDALYTLSVESLPPLHRVTTSRSEKPSRDDDNGGSSGRKRIKRAERPNPRVSGPEWLTQ